MTHNSHQLTLKKIFVFWLPLGATWLMMAIEGPFLAALIARLAEPKYNLAAYGVAFAFALIIEAPIIMIMSASTALVKDRLSFYKLKMFTYSLNTLITILMLIIIIPPIFYFLTEDLIGLPHRIAYLTHIATIILLPWAGAIGYRRFYQGILIRNNLTRLVAYGTVIRLITMTVTALVIYLYFDLPGAAVGATALSVAVIVEAVASRFMVSGVLKKLSDQPPSSGSELTYKNIYKFYYPLALTAILSLGVHPIVTFFIGKSRMPIESLAVLPVISSFVFIFRALGLSYQEVVIAYLGEDKSSYIPLRNFALILGGLLTFILIFIAFTPLSDFWFIDISGLSNSLSEFAKAPLMIMAIIPALTVLICYQRAVLVGDNNTGPITWGTAVEFTMIILIMLISINVFSLVGAIAATTSFVIGRLAANVYLTPSVNRSIKSFLA
jgi:hypothetical protein